MEADSFKLYLLLLKQVITWDRPVSVMRLQNKRKGTSALPENLEPATYIKASRHTAGAEVNRLCSRVFARKQAPALLKSSP